MAKEEGERRDWQGIEQLQLPDVRPHWFCLLKDPSQPHPAHLLDKSSKTLNISQSVSSSLWGREWVVAVSACFFPSSGQGDDK